MNVKDASGLKKRFARNIGWRKPFYKRIFCIHIYKQYVFYVEHGSFGIYICEKCGKMKGRPWFSRYD